MEYTFGMTPGLEISTRMVTFRPLEIKKCYEIFSPPKNEKQIMQMSWMVRSTVT